MSKFELTEASSSRLTNQSVLCGGFWHVKFFDYVEKSVVKHHGTLWSTYSSIAIQKKYGSEHRIHSHHISLWFISRPTKKIKQLSLLKLATVNKLVIKAIMMKAHQWCLRRKTTPVIKKTGVHLPPKNGEQALPQLVVKAAGIQHPQWTLAQLPGDFVKSFVFPKHDKARHKKKNSITTNK